ncbi:hypothetical protein [Streptomyces sp. NBC_01187]
MNGKRGNGEGSIYPYRNGGFAVRIRQAGVRAIRSGTPGTPPVHSSSP